MSEKGSNRNVQLSQEEGLLSQRFLPTQEFKTYPARWTVLLIYGLGSLVNAAIWISFASINSITREYYGVNDSAVNMLSVVYMILYIPGSFLASYLFVKLGLRGTMLTANVLNLLGAVLRYASAKNDQHPNDGGFGLLIVGQSLCGLVQPIFVNASAKIAATWFALESRDIATVIASMTNPIGTGLGQIWASLIVNDNGGIPLFLLTQFICSALVVVLVYFFFQDSPPTPPSFSQSTRHFSRQVSQVESKRFSHVTAEAGEEMSPYSMEDFKKLFRQPNFVWLSVGFGIGLAYFNSFVTVLGRLTEILDYSSDDAGILGALLLGFGLVGCAVAGPLMDYTHKYKTILRIFSTLAVCSVLSLCVVLRPNNFAALAIVISCLGFFMLPLLPISIECIVECTYPTPEEITSGIMISMGNVLSIGITFALQELINYSGKYQGIFVPYNYLQLGILVVTFMFIMRFNGSYKRLEAEHQSHSLATSNTDTLS
eukprot:CAMPEP_0167754196 /NCGR_PEP_ID=MMETSP0110_2-20121227/8133_1 /TAXON_ID=629695 /ORGANISM="Gymnochlora sp., Strain CCMP2014" /LENGTH=485 /DNA_ID=CAMNT_0007640043 /DNA_START=8 /DNA_END=1465 /DNA_ORIENTATION=-